MGVHLRSSAVINVLGWTYGGVKSCDEWAKESGGVNGGKRVDGSELRWIRKRKGESREEWIGMDKTT